MKKYLKIFLISTLAFFLLFYVGFKIFMETGASRYDKAEQNKEYVINNIELDKDKALSEEEIYANLSELEKLIVDSKRVNVLLLGVNSYLTDTMMVLSFDTKNMIADIISVPRDTYYYVPGRDRTAQKKINAVYGFGNGEGGIKGSTQAVEDVLGIPIHYTAAVEYDAVEVVVDVMGGVEYDIPFDMNYDDPYDTPPLHIHFKKGPQVLNGEDAVKFLRWRKNNNEGGQGDLPRINRQQDFLIAIAKQAIGPQLPMIIKAGYPFVKTDMSLDEALYYGYLGATNVDLNAIESYTIPGVPESVYYKHDPEATEQLMIDIYSQTSVE